MRRFTWGISVALLFLGMWGCKTPQLRNQIADQERMIRQLRQEKASVETRLRTTSGDLAEARGDLEAEKNRIQGLEDELGRLRTEADQAAPVVVAVDDGLELRKQELERLLRGTEGSVQVRDGDLVISLPGTITFASGSAKLTERGRGILSRIVGEVRGEYRDNTISIEGHTDADPVKKSKFATNWRLSVERAMAVREYLEQNSGVDPERFRVVGYGPYRPVANNRSSNGKERNRRVEIVIVTS